MTQVFISYSRKDIEFVEKLAAGLQSAGLAVWYDLSGLEGGTRWGTEIQGAIEHSQFFLVVLSPNSLESKWVQREFLYAETRNLKVIPLQYLPCILPMWLLDLQLIDLQGRNYERNFERLLKALGVQPQEVELPARDESLAQAQILAQLEAAEKERKALQEKQAQLKADELQRRQAEQEQAKARNKARKEVESRERKALRTAAWLKWKPKLPRILGLAGLGILIILGSYFLLPLIQGTQGANPQATTTSSTPTTSTTITPATPAEPFSGENWLRPADGMQMMYVPGGSFTMGGMIPEAMDLCKQNQNDCPLEWFNDTEPAHEVTLDEFWIDETEITNGDYEKCVRAGACQSPEGESSSSTIQNYFDDPKYANYPVIYISWTEAVNYCNWAGARLPTEAEWEMTASASGSRLYPWENTNIDSSLANYGKQVGDTTEVGLYISGVSLYGTLDMAGNVWEWVEDWYAAYPGGNPNANSYFGQTYKVLRGGSWADPFNLLAVSREYGTPDSEDVDIGFRCARSKTQSIQATPPPANTWKSPNDGMTLVSVPAGEFNMGSEQDSDFEKPVTKVYLDTFWIDTTEVTNSMYETCVSAGVCNHIKSTLSSGKDYFSTNEFRDYPVVNVTFWDAQIYCTWAGRRLPTEAEWEKAARGMDERTYPWGETIDTSLANYSVSAFGGPLAVGSYSNAKSPYGVLDMAGNVAEWTASHAMTYPYDPTDGREKIEGAIGENGLAVHGGSWNSDASSVRSFHREKITDNNSDDTIGFRCASSTSEPDSTQMSQSTPQPTEMASTWQRPADGMIMSYIPAGIVTLGSNEDYEFARPINSLSLEAFYIDQTEVTNSMYANCVAVGRCKAPSDLSSNTIQEYYGNPQYTKFPVSQVTWNDAKTYCEWAEARLPTEAEWEKAARGGVNSKIYPWGDEAPVCTPGAKNGAQFNTCSNANTAPVASFWMNAYGIYDMTGNVWEWTSSLYKPYPYSAMDGREDLNASGFRVLRGGSSCDTGISVAYRFFDSDPNNWHYCTGFRCARSAQP